MTDWQDWEKERLMSEVHDVLYGVNCMVDKLKPLQGFKTKIKQDELLLTLEVLADKLDCAWAALNCGTFKKKRKY